MMDGLRSFVQRLEAEGELKRVSAFVDPYLEITEIVDRVVKNGGPALLFENTGTSFPLLINAFGSKKRMSLVLGVDDLDSLSEDLLALMQKLTSPPRTLLDKWKALLKIGEIARIFPKTVKRKGKCQEYIYLNPDLRMLPVMTCWPYDGGPYITLPLVHTVDPETGIRNVGMYRVQVLDSKTTAIHWQLHKVSRRHFEKYRKRKEKMPVAIVLGGDPIYTYVATAPLPDPIDEYLLAGFLRKRPVRLVPCITQPLYVPEDADIVIEGYVDPEEPFVLEGPFGDHTGFYSLPDYYPRFHVTAITHRKGAIYPSTIVGIPPQEDAWLGKATERIFLAPIRATLLPELVDMDLPVEGGFHNLAIVKIQKTFQGQGRKVIHGIWGAGLMSLTKIVLVVDETVHVHDYLAVAKHFSEHFSPDFDYVVSQGPLDVLDHACDQMAFGGKLGLDATVKWKEEPSPIRDLPLPSIPEKAILEAYPEIKAINRRLIEEHGIRILLLTIEKSRFGHVQEVAKALFNRFPLSGLKVMVFFDPQVDIFDYGDAFWIFSSHTDVKRDFLYLPPKTKDTYGCLVFDATRKSRRYDHFPRPWPNPIVMSQEVIQKVNQRWEEYGLGTFLPSPSLRYEKLVVNEGAEVKED